MKLYEEIFERLEEIEQETESWKLPFLGFLIIDVFLVAFMIWSLFGLFVLPVGCLIDRTNLYEGWTEWCFTLGFLGSR